MKHAAGGCAGPGNVAAVLWDLRFHKNNIKHLPSPQNRTFRQNYPYPLAHLLYVKTFLKSIQKIQIFELFIVFTKIRHLWTKICEKCGLDFVFSISYRKILIYLMQKIHIPSKDTVFLTIFPPIKPTKYTKPPA